MAAANGLHLEFQLKNDTHIAQLGEVQVAIDQRPALKVVR